MNPHNDVFEKAGFEKDLREALRREAAPPDFAEKVLAKTVRAPLPMPRSQPKTTLQRPFTLALAAAVAAMAIIPAVVIDYRHREEVRGLKARQDLLTALAITRDQLQLARARVKGLSK